MNKEQKQDMMLKIIQDTVTFYGDDPKERRCISADGNCQYTWGDKHCAIGRYLKPKYQIETWKENEESVKGLMDCSEDYCEIDWCLRDEVHGLDVEFWADLQDMHDGRRNWNYEDKGLTLDGEMQCKKMIRNVKDDEYE